MRIFNKYNISILNFCFEFPFWRNFGSLAGFALCIQITTGLALTFWYVGSVDMEFLIREVNGDWLIRYLVLNCALLFFVVVYLHIGRNLFFGSFTYPREKLWISSIFVLLMMIVTAFLGYVLPWGQMSYWAATVITSLLSVVPLIGDQLLFYIWGGAYGDQPAFVGLYGLHYLLLFAGFLLLVVYFIFKSNIPVEVRVVSIVLKVISGLMLFHLTITCRIHYLGASKITLGLYVTLALLIFLTNFPIIKLFLEKLGLADFKRVKLCLLFLLNVLIWVCYVLSILTETSIFVRFEGLGIIVEKYVWTTERLSELFDQKCHRLDIMDMTLDEKMALLQKVTRPEEILPTLLEFLSSKNEPQGFLGSWLNWLGVDVLGLGRGVTVFELVTYTSFVLLMVALMYFSYASRSSDNEVVGSPTTTAAENAIRTAAENAIRTATEGAARTEIEAARLAAANEAARTEIEAARTGLEAARTGLEAARVAVEEEASRIAAAKVIVAMEALERENAARLAAQSAAQLAAKMATRLSEADEALARIVAAKEAAAIASTSSTSAFVNMLLGRNAAAPSFTPSPEFLPRPLSSYSEEYIALCRLNLFMENQDCIYRNIDLTTNVGRRIVLDSLMKEEPVVCKLNVVLDARDVAFPDFI